MQHLRTVGRVAAAAGLGFALTLIPLAAQADDINGSGGNDDIVGTDDPDTIDGDPPLDFVGGDDTIDGGGGDDQINGDSSIGSGLGGDDVIYGGDGDDQINGDNGIGGIVGGDDVIYGGDGDDQINGDNGIGGIIGGDDVIYGGDGDDFIRGDSGLGDIVGGDDELYGGEGDDVLLGQGGNDLLCGQGGLNVLIGGDGIDLACAVDDETDVQEDVTAFFDVSANDEVLDDDDPAEDGPLRYFLITVPTGITAVIDELTGILTVDAENSGVIEYEVRRYLEGDDYLSSLAEVIINFIPAPVDPVEPEDDDPVVDIAPVSYATGDVLPAAGGPASLGTLLGSVLCLLGGAVLVLRTRKQV